MDTLRSRAVRRAFGPLAPLPTAIDRLGFVQADPIRAPARAQDLILRQRVRDYRAGDLERAQPDLAIEEGVLYAYGFVGRAERPALDRPGPNEHPDVLRVLVELGPSEPRDLDAHLGRQGARNGWGGRSRASTLALERLHRIGHVRVRHRVAGRKVYEAARPPAPMDDRVRFDALVVLTVRALGPVLERTLRTLAAAYRKRAPSIRDHKAAIDALVTAGRLERLTVDGHAFIDVPETQADPGPWPVRLLAPFDPLVWCRRRFELLWGWAYRFEAYTPKAKRVRGYYALPLLHHDQVIGWANVGDDVDVGFVGSKPSGARFQSDLDDEISRLRAFMRAPSPESRGSQG